MNLRKIEILERKMTDLQLEVRNLISQDDQSAKEKVLELTKIQIELIDAIKANKQGKPIIN